MKPMWDVARREFRSYFDHATAYVLVVAFLAVTLYLGFRSILASGMATLRPLFDLLPWLLAVFVPAITMRSLAEERRSGTLEWLVSQPLTEVQIVAGKFLGDWLFALAALAGTLPAAAGLLLVSDADPGILVAQYAGAALLAAAMVAIGLFTSSATQNQITAFIAGTAVSFALVLAGTNFTLMGLPPFVSDLVGRLSLLTHFDSVARGVVDLRDVLYFVTVAGLFLALATWLLVRDRLSAERGAYRRLRTGVASIAAGVVVLNLLGSHIGGRLDLTRNDLYTLSPGTKSVLGDLDDVVTLKLFVSDELPPEVRVTLRDIRDLAADFRRASDGRIRVEEVDPDDSEEAASEARTLGVRPIQFNVMRGDEFQVQRGWLGLAVLYAGERETLPVIRSTEDLEYRLASAVASLVRERTPRVRFLTGFGATGAGRHPELRDMLSDRYDVGSTRIEGDSLPPLTPDSADVVVLAGPTRPLDAAARSALDGYLREGGAGLLLTEGVRTSPRAPTTLPVSAGLDSLLAPRGLRLRSGVVYDLRSNQRVSTGGQGGFSLVRPYPFWPVARPSPDHAVTRDLDAVSLAWARPLQVSDSSRVEPLLRTTGAAGVRPPGSPVSPTTSFDPAAEDLEVRVLAAAVSPDAADSTGSAEEEGPGGRLVVVGDADFVASRFVQGARQNLVFAANAVDWLAQDAALIGIRSKDRTPPPLVFESETGRALFRWGNLVGVPLVFVLIGGWRILRRRRLAGIQPGGEEVGA